MTAQNKVKSSIDHSSPKATKERAEHKLAVIPRIRLGGWLRYAIIGIIGVILALILYKVALIITKRESISTDISSAYQLLAIAGGAVIFTSLIILREILSNKAHSWRRTRWDVEHNRRKARLTTALNYASLFLNDPRNYAAIRN